MFLLKYHLLNLLAYAIFFIKDPYRLGIEVEGCLKVSRFKPPTLSFPALCLGHFKKKLNQFSYLSET